MFLCSRERILDVVSALKIHLVGLHRSDINTNRYVRSCQILEAKQAGAWIVLGLATITNQLPAKLATFANLHRAWVVFFVQQWIGKNGCACTKYILHLLRQLKNLYSSRCTLTLSINVLKRLKNIYQFRTRGDFCRLKQYNSHLFASEQMAMNASNPIKSQKLNRAQLG